MRKKMRVVLLFAVPVFLFIFSACPNGVRFERDGKSAGDGSVNRPPDNIELPGFSPDLPPGDKVFTISVSEIVKKPEAESDVRLDPASLNGEIYVKNSTSSKQEFTFNLTIEGIAEDLIIPAEGETPEKKESGSINLTSVYEKKQGEDSFATVTFGEKLNKIEVKRTEDGSPVTVPVTIILDNAQKNQMGLLKIKMDYSKGIYNPEENFSQLGVFVYNFDPTTGGAGKPMLTVVDIKPTSDAIKQIAGTWVLTDSEYKKSSTDIVIPMEMVLKGVESAAPVTMAVDADKANNIEIRNIQSDSTDLNKLTFDMVYKAATTAEDVLGSFTFNLKPQSDAEDFYASEPITVHTERVVVKPKKTVTATVASQTGSGSYADGKLTYYDVNRAAAAADKTLSFTVALNGLDAGVPLSLAVASDAFPGVKANITKLTSAANTAVVTLTVPHRDEPLDATGGTVTLTLSGHNPFMYKEDSVTKIDVNVTRTAPPIPVVVNGNFEKSTTSVAPWIWNVKWYNKTAVGNTHAAWKAGLGTLEKETSENYSYEYAGDSEEIMGIKEKIGKSGNAAVFLDVSKVTNKWAGYGDLDYTHGTLTSDELSLLGGIDYVIKASVYRDTADNAVPLTFKLVDASSGAELKRIEIPKGFSTWHDLKIEYAPEKNKKVKIQFSKADWYNLSVIGDDPKNFGGDTGRAWGGNKQIRFDDVSIDWN